MKRLIFLAIFLPFLASAQEPATEMGVNATTAAVDELLPILEQIQTNTAASSLLAPAECVDDNLSAFNIEFSGNYFRRFPETTPAFGIAWYLRSEAIKVYLTTATTVRILTRDSVGHNVGTFATQAEAEACRDILVAML